MAATASQRQYERGENRRKHVGTSSKPKIVLMPSGEHVGKCPAGLPADRRQTMLERGIGVLTEAPYSAEFPRRLFTVDDDGTVYAGQTSNPGQSYHGYPYHGRLGKHLLAALRAMAREKNCETGFNQWVKRHIMVGGPPEL